MGGQQTALVFGEAEQAAAVLWFPPVDATDSGFVVLREDAPTRGRRARSGRRVGSGGVVMPSYVTARLEFSPDPLSDVCGLHAGPDRD